MEAGKVVLITGSSTGFGRLAAETLARKGYSVFASMREASGRNAGARGELLNLGEKEKLSIKVLDLDVSSEASVNRGVEEVIDHAGRIDVLVNNAGFVYWGITEAFSVEQAQRVFDTNFFGVVRMNRAVLPHMRRQGSGLLLHVSSGAGRGVVPAMGLYTASKFALEALAETYRYELSQLGVDSVLIEPGPYATAIFGKVEQPADQERSAEYGATAEVPGRVQSALESSPADPQEVADAIAELIETPAGKRPLRRLIGPIVTSLQPLNDASERIQREILQALGLGHLLTFRAPRSAAA
jgi:NAD(P)-dependent dehydrogenase (short-subunit alcohol dehydrogenase family)